MKVRYSEIWYNYTASYAGSVLPQSAVAISLINEEFTRCVSDSEGNYYFVENNEIKKDKIKMETDSRYTAAKINLEDWPSDNYTREVLYQNCLNNFYEEQHFSLKAGTIDHKYIRFSLDEIRLIKKDHNIRLYPFINYYASGVIIIEFRVIYDYLIDIKEFIDKYLNLTTEEFDFVYADKSLASISKMMLNKDDTTNIADLEDSKFNFEYYELDLDSNRKTIGNIALQIFSVLEFILDDKQKRVLKKIKHKLRNKYKFEAGQFWFGKPHVHILEFENQKRLSSENFEKYKKEIIKILNRVFLEECEYNYDTTLKDLRRYEDFNSFFNLSLSLVVWSQKGLDDYSKWKEENYNQFVYSNQVVSKFLDYYQMLYKKSAFLIRETKEYDAILRFQSDFYQLKNDYLHFARSSELKEILDYAKNEFEIENHEEIIKEYLEVKRLKIESKKNKSFNLKMMFVTIFFGLVSSGTIANDIAKPIWHYFNLPVFRNTYLNDICSWSAIFFILLILIFIIFKKIGK